MSAEGNGLELLETQVCAFRAAVFSVRLVVGRVLFDEIDRFLQPLRELLEILLVEENFVLVVGETAVPFDTALAFGDGQVVVITLGRLNIEEVGALPRPDGPGIHILTTTLTSVAPVIVIAIHCD